MRFFWKIGGGLLFWATLYVTLGNRQGRTGSSNGHTGPICSGVSTNSRVGAARISKYSLPSLAKGPLPYFTLSFSFFLFVTLSLAPLLLYPSPFNAVSRLTYFNIWRGGPPGRRTNRLTWHMPSCQMVQSAAGNRTDIWNFLCKQTAYFSWWIILNTTAYIQARASFATRYTAATQYVNMYVRRTRNIAVAFRRPLAENFTLRRTRIGKKTTTKKKPFRCKMFVSSINLYSFG